MNTEDFHGILALQNERDELRAKLDDATRQRELLQKACNDYMHAVGGYKEKLDAAERAASEMRTALEHDCQLTGHDRLTCPIVNDALASDAGRDYVPRAKVDAALASLRIERDHADRMERSCAEMREALKYFNPISAPLCDLVAKALSSNAGRDYVTKSEVEEAWRNGMMDAAQIALSDRNCAADKLSKFPVKKEVRDQILAACDARKPAQ